MAHGSSALSLSSMASFRACQPTAQLTGRRRWAVLTAALAAGRGSPVLASAIDSTQRPPRTQRSRRNLSAVAHRAVALKSAEGRKSILVIFAPFASFALNP
jgi:hypothetical protein